MLKSYLIVSYAYLVKIGRWDLEPVEGGTKSVVPEAYRTAVAEHLAAQTA
jgi:hypothetical protein